MASPGEALASPGDRRIRPAPVSPADVSRWRRQGRSGRAMPGLAVALAAFTLLVAAAPARGQSLIEVSAQAGALAPLSSLRDDGGVTGAELKMETRLAGALSAALLLPRNVSLEVRGLWTPSSGLVGGSSDAEADFRAVTGGFTYRFDVPLLGILAEPFLGGGVGVRDLSFRGGTSANPLPADESSVTGELLVGSYVTAIPFVRLRLELRDYISSFDDRGDASLRHDLALLGGISARLP